jgi:cytochrome c oxidase cbb3-type subunit 3
MSDQPAAEPKTGAFARSKGEIVIREHVYDGIKEYDQKLPNWWLFTFYVAIAWFLAYWVLYYHAGAYQTDHEKLTARLGRIEQAKQEQLAATLASLDNEILITKWAKDPAILANGEAVYTTTCTACHGANLSATMDVGGMKIPLPGLSLIDGEWKFGGQPMDIFKLVNEGSPPESAGHNGARMQAWGQTLGPQKVAEVTAYVISKLPEFKR